MKLVVLVLACGLAATATASARPSVPPKDAALVATPRPHTWIVLRQRPGGRRLAVLHRRTEFGARVKLGVAAIRGAWVGVISERLPNGVLGWIPRKWLTLQRIAWTVDVSLSRRVLEIRHGGEVVRRVRIGVGAQSSPTPLGRYVITDHVSEEGKWGGAYGCCVLVLSGHQPHPPSGWDPTRDWRLAIHGGGTGGATSAGCLHADEKTLRLLMTVTPLGTPVTVSR
jgi:hypothetical protein